MAHALFEKNIINTLVALTLGVGIIVSTGVLYGRYSQRWGPQVQLVEAGRHLDSMPPQIGAWQLAEETKMSESVVAMLECAGHVNRRYINQETGKSVTVALIVGPPGPIAVHTPEICYSSRAYEIQGVREAVAIENRQSELNTLWAVNFKSRNVMADQLRTYYAWSRGKRWEASESPRYEFAAAPLLYKIQLASSIESGSTNDDQDSCRQFFQDLVDSNWNMTGFLDQTN